MFHQIPEEIVMTFTGGEPVLYKTHNRRGQRHDIVARARVDSPAVKGLTVIIEEVIRRGAENYTLINQQLRAEPQDLYYLPVMPHDVIKLASLGIDEVMLILKDEMQTFRAKVRINNLNRLKGSFTIINIFEQTGKADAYTIGGTIPAFRQDLFHLPVPPPSHQIAA